MSHPSENAVEGAYGSYIDVRDPDPATIELRDIAHMLALTNRFNGATGRYNPVTHDRDPVALSVAEHAVNVSRRVEQKGGTLVDQLGAVHHDDAEYVMNDIVRPVKPIIGSAYVRITNRLDRAIIASLGLPFGPEMFHSRIVLGADRFCLMVEARELIKSQGRGWMRHAEAWDLRDVPERIIRPDYFRIGLTPIEAKANFIARHNELMEALNGAH